MTYWIYESNTDPNHYFGDSTILRKREILETGFSKPELNFTHLKFIFADPVS
jgi:hypothetical protein